jgi:hypothetical protein
LIYIRALLAGNAGSAFDPTLQVLLSEAPEEEKAMALVSTLRSKQPVSALF